LGSGMQGNHHVNNAQDFREEFHYLNCYGMKLIILY
jgi:hypothetical protein